MTVVRRNKPVPTRAAQITFLLIALKSAPALLGERGLAENQPVPELRAPDLEGRLRTLADFAGRATLLVFWEPDHDRSLTAVCEVARLAARYEPAALATIASGHDKADVERALAACAVKPAVLLDRDRALFGAFQIVALPTAMIVAPDRKLLFKTAGFNAAGLGAIEAKLDEIYGRRKPVPAAPAGAPEALRRYGMAQQLLKVGMQAQAEKSLEALTAAHPEFRPAWVSLGYCRIAANRPEEARAAFDKALALDRASTGLAPGMAWLAGKRGDSAQAAKWAAAADEKDPHYELIREMRKQSGPQGGPR